MSIAESGSSVTVDHREGALNLQGLLTSPNFTGRQFSVYPFKVLFIWVMGKKCLSLSWQDIKSTCWSLRCSILGSSDTFKVLNSFPTCSAGSWMNHFNR
ncbi:uncharacterized protein LOC114186099 isoform X2 [Vigna unguiculata]|uniref:uncharacterized protein LOC114186099 isoform X2 n=1 Tax=Vigna unguiculata TaxID=3917 RepID=UPI001015DEF7|nr:uncharacterized protein LOC114186099 isoform X2 [Vigna unguiculata]